MTIISHLEAPAAPLPPAVPTDYIYAAEDIPAEDVQAVVTLKLAMTRDMLASAFDLAMRGAYDENIDTMPVEEIRHRVELSVHLEGPWTLLRDSVDFSDMACDPTVGGAVRAVYRAVDRAYPHLAPKENH
ncbi:hypothetical protein ACFWH1_29440 [Streptomyces sp. NPDC127037]|uniref:hypothetical protein n=1 Tax=Streptomyces sp. NPDC127037 TaxID=3347113 RepID=UPI003647829C